MTLADRFPTASPIVGVILMIALTVALATIIGVLILPSSGGATEPQPQPIQNLSTFEADDGECILEGRFDPEPLASADRIVVEIDGHAALFDHGTYYSREDIVKGSNVTVYGVGLASTPDPEHGRVEMLLDGHLGPECQLVRHGGETA